MKALLVVTFLTVTVFAKFPSKEENLKLAEKAVKELKELVDADKAEVWPDLEREEDDLKIYTKESPFPELSENIYLAETVIKANVTKVYELLKPWGELRTKWDDLYEYIKVIDKINENTYVVHEAIHAKLLLSARDAVVVCQKADFGKEIVMACHNTTSAEVPESDDYVRTVKRLNGFSVKPYSKDPKWTELKLLLGVDLNLKVGFFSSIVNRFKPGQLSEFVERLNAALPDYYV
ncbi:unnamed protein product [Bursaphelenchus xylophilus]|uniref:(pine wood nematode) hypothetical protein n=1 Tax=Bursaphelenchus xylophilus TaxID=6326 RepID=A0A1I7RNL3_BURXY|nr:unnamed protein product [Bursaphelenchus xylophilus]CAG9124138.1 unnamed protein product [Bursaphelenchus xylophilus]